MLSELGGSGATANQGGYYDTHAGFAGVGVASSAAEIYDTINTMSQATSQNLYTPPLAGSLGKYYMLVIFMHGMFFIRIMHVQQAKQIYC